MATWSTVIKPGSISNEIVCLTDIVATTAEVISYKLKDNEGVDSHSFLYQKETKELQEKT
tara:strand:+ start:3423 stop:3602 length:180 start_codon:yes stop_codon:yes gene_type:complete